MRQSGNILLALLFFVFLALAGLVMFNSTLAHERVARLRLQKGDVVAALQGELHLALHSFRNQVAAADMGTFSRPAEDFFVPAIFPDWQTGLCTIQHLFTRRAVSEYATFRRYGITLEINALARKYPLQLGSRVYVELLQGRIPLAEFPLWIRTDPEGSAADFLRQQNIELNGECFPLVRPDAIVDDSPFFLAQVLDIDPEVICWKFVRPKLQLPELDQPPPAGVYLILTSGALKGIFVQGDVDCLTFAVSAGQQEVQIRQGGETRAFRYLPGGRSFCDVSAGTMYSATFLEQLIFNGNIARVEQEGEAAFFNSCQICLLVMGKVCLQSSLLCQQSPTEESPAVPLILITSTRTLAEPANRNADLTLECPGNVRLDGSLLLSGQLVNKADFLAISGSFCASNVANSGEIHVQGKTRSFSAGSFWRSLDCAFVRKWRIDYVDEEHHE